MGQRHGDTDGQPPKWGEALLRASLHRDDRDDAIGDLAEEYAAVAQGRRGIRHATSWYWHQVLASLVPNLARRLRSGRLDSLFNPRHEGDPMIMELLQDVRGGLRGLITSPVFALVTILPLVLAIAVNTVIFSVINTGLLGDLPTADPDTMGWIYLTDPRRSHVRTNLSEPEYLDFRERTRAFASLAALHDDYFVVVGAEEPLRVLGNRATANLLDVWGAEAALGRNFLPGEDQPSALPVVMISFGFWEGQYGRDPDVIGGSLRVDGIERTIIGVVAERMELGAFSEVKLWIPLRVSADADRAHRVLDVSGRLAAGFTLEQAGAEVESIAAQLGAEHPITNQGWGALVMDWHHKMTGDAGWTILYLMVLTVGFVMLIACSSVATNVLARGAERGHEIAIRSALGASRARLVRQSLTEGLLLGITAGLLGLGLTRALLNAIIWILDGSEVIWEQVTLDTRVMGFALGLSLLAPVLFGLLPALRSSRPDLAAMLAATTNRATGSRGRARRRAFLVALQTALAVVLLVVAGLMARSMIELSDLDAGFVRQGLLSLRVDLPEAQYPEEADTAAFFARASARLEEEATVSTAWVHPRPLVAVPAVWSFEVEGRERPENDSVPWVRRYIASPSLPSVLGVTPLRGRFLSVMDGRDVAPVVALNNEAVRRFWPDEDPIGARIRFGNPGHGPWLQVVGVVPDFAATELTGERQPQAFVPMAQSTERGFGLLARGGGDAGELADRLRAAIWDIDPQQPVADVRTIERAVYDEYAGAYVVTGLMGAMAMFALIMAASGLYGVTVFAVSRRTRELGIRRALGASAWEVVTLIARQSVVAVGLGAALGMLGAFAVSRGMQAALVGTSENDPTTFLGVPLLLIVVAVVAALVPAMRALRIDPARALRDE